MHSCDVWVKREDVILNPRKVEVRIYYPPSTTLALGIFGLILGLSGD